MYEHLKMLWAIYWDVRADKPDEAKALKAAIEKITAVFSEYEAEIRKLRERNEETERLLKAAYRSSQRRREP